VASQSAHSGFGESFGVHDHPSWQHPYRKTRIYFHRDVVRALSSQALHHLRQGMEIGGILWGKPVSGDSIAILDATPVPSGSQFNTTAVDIRNLAQVIEGQAPQASLVPAGYFRSHIRPGLSLSPQDRRLIEQHFPDSESVFLIIKPFEAGACMAGFFFWRDGRLTEESDLEVPFVADNETRRQQPLTAPDPIPQKTSIVDILRESAMRHQPPQRTAAKPSPSSAPLPPPARPPPKRSLWGAFVIAVLLFTILIVGGASLYFNSPNLRSLLQLAVPKPPDKGLDLQVARAPDGQLTLTWNQNAPEVLTASGGTLFVTDGRGSPKLPLDNAQLRSGKLLYFPKGEDVQFRLELNVGSGHTVAESVRVMSPGGKTRRKRRLPASHSNQLARADTPAASAAFIATDAIKASPPLSLGPLRPPSPSLLPGIPVPRPQSEPNSAYVPPRVIQEMMPETNPLGQFAQISVQVTINTTGHVVGTHAAENAGPTSDALTAIALKAARQWRFQPATLNGKPIPAEYTIVFAFHPQLP
jgi:hypothetical protein